MQKHYKRQAKESVVHVTVTAAGTVVYTQTATSYSYIPSYSTISQSPTASSSNNDPQQQNNNNLGAIIGGVVGGLAGIILIGLVFLFMCRRKKQPLQDYTPTMNSVPRKFVAPLLDTKHYLLDEGGYYEDMTSTPFYYSSGPSTTSEPSTATGTVVDRHVPNEIDRRLDPPHSKD